ncbi:MAG: thioesterase superfamily protein, partial [bacterium]|nr:thioesterase superfamily protein [bacterium]
MPVPPKEFLHLIQEIIPFNKFLGITIDEAKEGYVRLQLPYRPEYIGDASRPALHGGVISTLV